MTPHTDRRGASAPSFDFILEADTLIQRSSNGDIVTTLSIAEISEVRLSVDMAGQASQVVCHLTSTDGQTLTFGSMHWIGPASWKSTSDTFSDLLAGIHDALAIRGGSVRYVEGQGRLFLTAMFALGLAITGGAGYGFFDLFFIKEVATGLFLLPVVAMGLWLMRLFWPKGEKFYDPATYQTAATSS
jgi:hypothetical protein